MAGGLMCQDIGRHAINPVAQVSLIPYQVPTKFELVYAFFTFVVIQLYTITCRKGLC